MDNIENSQKTGYCEGGNVMVLNEWDHYNGSKRRCPKCGKRLTLKTIIANGHDHMGYAIPEHKPKGHKIPNKVKRK